jgi:hypothetical protein
MTFLKNLTKSIRIFEIEITAFMVNSLFSNEFSSWHREGAAFHL